MRCEELNPKVATFSGMKQLWDDAFDFIYKCSEYDQTYMANIISKVQNVEANFNDEIVIGVFDQYSGLKVSKEHFLHAVLCKSNIY